MAEGRTTLTIYFPQRHRENGDPLERLQKLAEEQDRSVNYLAVQAILEYVEREENS